MEVDRSGQDLLINVEHNGEWSSRDWRNTAKHVHEKYKTIEEENEEELDVAWDDVFGAELDPQKVRRAREEEIEYVKKMDLYEKVAI